MSTRTELPINVVYHCNALSVLMRQPTESVDLVYIDPPFGTGRRQALNRHKRGEVISVLGYEDPRAHYLEWLQEHMLEVKRVLKPSGTLYLHLDQRWSHRVRVMLEDSVFGEDNYLNTVIWSYNFGGRGKDRWPQKHDDILVYVKSMKDHIFNWDDVPRIPYAAPDLQKVGRTPEDAQRRIELGQVPTDVWQLSIVGTASKERNGYPTQKPVKLIERAILASSPKGGVVMDVFGGSGTTGAAAHKHGRRFILADISLEAIDVMKRRFKDIEVEWHDGRPNQISDAEAGPTSSDLARSEH